MDETIIKELHRRDFPEGEFVRTVARLRQEGYRVLERTEDFAKLELKVKIVYQSLSGLGLSEKEIEELKNKLTKS